MTYWSGRRVLVTGGASFIGSHLTDTLVELGARVKVVDDLSSGRREYIQGHLDGGRVDFLEGNLLKAGVARDAAEGVEVVFHLAADHGGRGYVDLHQAACAGNLALDGLVFLACRDTGVQKVIYASSACVYPGHLQGDSDKVLYLPEEAVGPPYDADNMYGWAKLMAEMTLRAYCDEWGMKGVSCRYFTVYGERGKEDHAVMAMIARAFVGQDPFVVWGNGRQVRNWTYVKDIVRGTILAAEKIDDGSAVNLGTAERIRVIDAVHEVLRQSGHEAKTELHPEMPTGPVNRVADNSRAAEILGWKPEVSFREGLRRTMDWYFASKDREEVKGILEKKLTAR